MSVPAVIGVLVALGVTLAPVPVKAEAEYEIAAEDASPEAMFALGVMLDEGISAPRNYPQAYQCYARAAERGHAEAMNRCILYAMGHGVPKDYVAAFAWYLQAARNGSVSSACNIATAYFHGLGVP